MSTYSVSARSESDCSASGANTCGGSQYLDGRTAISAGSCTSGEIKHGSGYSSCTAREGSSRVCFCTGAVYSLECALSFEVGFSYRTETVCTAWNFTSLAGSCKGHQYLDGYSQLATGSCKNWGDTYARGGGCTSCTSNACLTRDCLNNRIAQLPGLEVAQPVGYILTHLYYARFMRQM